MTSSHPPRVSRPYEGWDDQDEESVVVVEVSKKGMPLPILETSILTDRMNRRTRGGKNRVRGAGRRDHAFECCSKWTSIIVVETGDDLLSTERVARYQTVKTSSPFEIIKMSEHLPPITSSSGQVAALSAALSVLAAGLLKAPLKQLSVHPPLFFSLPEGGETLDANPNHFLFKIGVRHSVANSQLFTPTYPTTGILPSPPSVLISLVDDFGDSDFHLTLEVPLNPEEAVQYFRFLNSFGRIYDLILEAGNSRLESVISEEQRDNKRYVELLDSFEEGGTPHETDATICGQVGYFRSTGSIAFLTLLLTDVNRKVQIVIPSKVHQTPSTASMIKALCPGDHLILKSPTIGINSTGVITTYASSSIMRMAPINEILPTVDFKKVVDSDTIIYCDKPSFLTVCPHSGIRDNEHPTAQHILERMLSAKVDDNKKCKLHPVPLILPRFCSGVQMFSKQAEQPEVHTSTSIMLCSNIDGEHEDLKVVARFEFCYLAILQSANQNPLFLSPGFGEAIERYKVINGTSSGGSGVHKMFVKRYNVRRIMLHITNTDSSNEDDIIGCLPSDFHRVLQSLPLTWRSPHLVPKGFFFQSNDVLSNQSAVTFIRSRTTLPVEIASLPEEVIRWVSQPEVVNNLIFLSNDERYIITLGDYYQAAAQTEQAAGEADNLATVKFLREVLGVDTPAGEPVSSKWRTFDIPHEITNFEDNPIVKDLITKNVVRLMSELKQVQVVPIRVAICDAISECPSTEKAASGGVPLSWLVRKVLPWINVFMSGGDQSDPKGKLNKWDSATKYSVTILNDIMKTDTNNEEQHLTWIKQGLCTEVLHQSGCCCQYHIALVSPNAKTNDKQITPLLESRKYSNLESYLLLVRETGRTHSLASLELQVTLNQHRSPKLLNRISSGLYLFEKPDDQVGFNFDFNPTVLRKSLRVWSTSAADFLSQVKSKNIQKYTMTHEVSDTLSQELLPLVSLSRIQNVVAAVQHVLGTECKLQEDGVTHFCVLYLPNNETIFCEDMIEMRDWNIKVSDFIKRWELKPFSFSGSMEPSVAITIANVAVGVTRSILKLPPTATLDVVDGCCGSGTLSAAAATLNCQVYSSELRADFASKTTSNFEHLSVQDMVSLNIQDATKPYPANVRSNCKLLLCNPPWGVRFGSSCDSIPIVSALTRSFPKAVWCFVAPKSANDVILSAKKPLAEKLFRIQFGCVEILIAKGVLPTDEDEKNTNFGDDQ
eukprot:TRINITY_DN15863_c0_g1_i1.p1 TRINITY_DN15863_c0_g1~~TRINITY_DN15863_c0_g1_i1.p1  ORF type:complete len:1224 (+),score=200.36 TRINITY_DN15863_c0_g1_i1:46-3717(+)